MDSPAYDNELDVFPPPYLELSPLERDLLDGGFALAPLPGDHMSTTPAFGPISPSDDGLDVDLVSAPQDGVNLNTILALEDGHGPEIDVVPASEDDFDSELTVASDIDSLLVPDAFEPSPSPALNPPPAPHHGGSRVSATDDTVASDDVYPAPTSASVPCPFSEPANDTIDVAHPLHNTLEVPHASSSTILASTAAVAAAPIERALSAKAAGKRKAAAVEVDTRAPVKRRRGPPPTPQGFVVCAWNGCDASVPRAEARSHSLVHLDHTGVVHGVEGPFVCKWGGCRKATPRGKPGYGTLEALLKHLRDVHFQVKHVECPFEGCTHRGRDDSMSRHKEACLHNPERKQAEQENQDDGGDAV